VAEFVVVEAFPSSWRVCGGAHHKPGPMPPPNVLKCLLPSKYTRLRWTGMGFQTFHEPYSNVLGRLGQTVDCKCFCNYMNRFASPAASAAQGVLFRTRTDGSQGHAPCTEGNEEQMLAGHEPRQQGLCVCVCVCACVCLCVPVCERVLPAVYTPVASHV